MMAVKQKRRAAPQNGGSSRLLKRTATALAPPRSTRIMNAESALPSKPVRLDPPLTARGPTMNPPCLTKKYQSEETPDATPANHRPPNRPLPAEFAVSSRPDLPEPDPFELTARKRPVLPGSAGYGYRREDRFREG